MKLKSRRVGGGGSHCGTSEVAGGGGCERSKFRRVEGGGIEDESSFWFGLKLIVDYLVFLFFELWIEGLVLPFVLNSDNGGTSEVAGGGGCERFKLRLVGGGGIEDGSNFLFGVLLSVDCLFFLLCELWIEGLVLPFVLNSDNGGTSEVAGGGGCERFKLRLVGGGGIEDGSNFLFGVLLSVDCLFFLLCELWIEGLVLPFVLNSDNGGTIEVVGERSNGGKIEVVGGRSNNGTMVVVGGSGLMGEMCFVVELGGRLFLIVEGSSTIGEQAMFRTEDKGEC